MLLTECSVGQEHQLHLGAYEKCKPSFPTPDLLTESSAPQLILPHNSVRSLPGPDWKSLFPLKLALSSLPEQKYSDLLQHWAAKMGGTKGLGRKRLSLQNPLRNLWSFKGLWNHGIHATHFSTMSLCDHIIGTQIFATSPELSHSLTQPEVWEQNMQGSYLFG